jgi:endoglucanase
MASTNQRRSLTLVGLGFLGLLGFACAGGGSSGGPPATGGATGTGGATSTGGATGKGGAVGSGGAAQKGGSTGTGGFVATGGSTGTGGGTGTGGAGYTCTGCKVTIAASCQSTPGTQTIRMSVDVVDGTLNALPLSTVTFRYWFVLGETTDPPVLGIDYAQVGASALTSQFVPVSPAVTGANEYLEIGFTDGAPTLSSFGDSGPINLQVHGMGYSTSFDLDQTADYSYQPCGDASATTLVNAPTITGYINGVLAWGHEPK